MSNPKGSSNETSVLPLVSVIIPCRNEAHYLSRSLGALLRQTYPHDRLEIVVVDGQSEDGSAQLARQILSSADVPWRVCNNPDRNTPAAMNLGLRESTGYVVIIASAHCELNDDYVERAVVTLDRTGADCVGGAMMTRGEDRFSQAAALALSSAFGVGGVTFRTRTDFSGFVDTVPFGAYRREVFDRIGPFDPAFLRNQDSELNFRITRSGGKIWLDSGLRSVYYSRRTIRTLWMQHFNTGSSKIQILAKHGRMPALRHYIPGLFVAAAVAASLLAVLLREPLIALIVLGPYALATIFLGAWAARGGARLYPLVLITLPVLHFSYGLGFLAGLPRMLKRHTAQEASWRRMESPPPRTRS